MPKPSTAAWILLLILAAGLLPIVLYVLPPAAQQQVPSVAALPFRSMPSQEQAAQVIAGLFIKPLYTLIALAALLALIGQPGADLAALRWALGAFVVGETFCAVNFYIYNHESLLSEYAHSYGMVLAFGFTAFALLDGLDARVLKLSNSDAPCAAVGLCGKCTRHQAEGCKARSMARFMLPILAGLLFIPLFSPLQPDAYAVSLFGFPYSYTRWNAYEMYERRVLPLLGLALFAIAFVPLLRRKSPPVPPLSKAMVAAGLGAFGFSFFRLVLNAIFATDLVWFEFWEEATELAFIALVALTLWEFRRTLLPVPGFLKTIGLYAP